jgi:hypothetical protein
VLRPAAAPGDPLEARGIVDELRWILAATAGSAAPPVVVGGRADVVDALVPMLCAQLRLPVRRLADLPIAGVPHGLVAAQGEYATALGLALGPLRTRVTVHGFEATGSSPRASEARALRQEIRRTRAIAAAILALLALHAGFDWAAARRRLERGERLLRSGLAAVSRPGDAVASVAELQERVSALEAACGVPDGCGGPLALLERLSRAIPESIDVVIERIEMDGSNAVVEGRAASGVAVDQLRHALAGFGNLVAPPAPGEVVLGGTQQPVDPVAAGEAGLTFRLHTTVGTDAAPPPPTAPQTAKGVDA